MPLGSPQSSGSAIPPQPPPVLARASWLESLWSLVRPAQLTVTVAAAFPDEATAVLTPGFSVDGKAVSPEHVATAPGRPVAGVRTILGHRVCVGPATRVCLGETGGRQVEWPLPRAAAALQMLARAGVPVVIADTGVPLSIGPARLDVDLALGPDDCLAITTTLRGPGGEAIEKPADLRRLAAREGWQVTGWGLVRISSTGSSLDQLLAESDGPIHLHGTDIPRLLDGLERRFAPLGTLRRLPGVADVHRVVNVPPSIELRVNVVERAGQALLRVDPIHRHERFQVGHDEALAVLATGDVWLRRRGAWIGLDAERAGAIDRTAAALGLTLAGEGFEFPAADRERVLDAFATLGGIRQTDAFGRFLASLADVGEIEEVPLPANLRSSVRLRPYQRHGVNWLAFLQRFGLNGILADDMGLGKTLQTLTAVERAREATGLRLPVLIICPTSVMLNWRSEIGKFLEASETILFHGPARSRHVERITAAATAAEAPLYVITSFDCARIDHDTLARIGWLYVIVDEGHTIKNPDAKRSKAIKTIPGRHKLALTGTPIQNKLEELWSLFDFAMPGFLESRGSFRRRYTINNRVDWPAVNEHLIPRIRPFVLRRLKSAVARDLPEKILVERQVPLTPLQVTLYNAVRDSAEFRQMREAVERDGVARSQTHIFAALTKLQNICNHPAIETVGVLARSALPADSGKLDLLQELIEEVVEGGHRALVFSQSTRVLDLVGHWFGQWGVKSLRIDGSTPALDRARLADTFNADASIHAFLLSTRAAGTGLNLVGADTVIFYDHDWNPANDAQAMDRAYRIGQTRNVTVYKLVSRGTLEEKILARQSEKLMLAEGVIGADPGGFKDLSREELLDLFTLDGEA